MASPALSFDQPNHDFVVPMLQTLDEWQPRIRLTGNHRYQVQVPGSEKWEYKPGTTTIIKSGGFGSENLIGWAARVQREADLRLLDECEWDQLQFRSKCGKADAHTRIRDAAADSGTDMHTIFEIECKRMMNEKIDFPLDMTDEQKKVLDKFRRWAMLNDLQPLGCELRVWHPILDYCGTLDLLAILRGAVTIIDYKGRAERLTKPYDGHIFQSSAYRDATAKLTTIPVDKIAGEIVTFPRPGANLDVESFPVKADVGRVMAGFQACLTLHALLKEIR